MEKLNPPPLVTDSTQTIDPPDVPHQADQHNGLNLFWRTFFLLALLLIGSAMAWIQTLHEMEQEPRAIQTARHIATVVGLSRAAVLHADTAALVSLFKTLYEQEQLRITPSSPSDVVEPLGQDDLSLNIAAELAHRLGPNTPVAKSVNHVKGLWVGFAVAERQYWLQTDLSRFKVLTGRSWLVWLLSTTVLSLLGAAWMARLINRPLKELSFAASRVRDGDFAASALNESVTTSEIREVNIGFNRMTQKLAKIEQDRAVMLAGISHDLRTPLARLRLETELSVADLNAREHMVSDIDQLDGIIEKFLDYARPGNMGLKLVSFAETVDICLQGFRKRNDMKFKQAIEGDLFIMADPIEIQRIITNLLENAGRYGKSPDTGVALVDISAKSQNKVVLIRVRDHGAGVPPEQLKQLTTPFFRGESARTAANGTGLGLAIVEKTILRMGGEFELINATSGGLCANIKLQRGFTEVTNRFDRRYLGAGKKN